MRPVRSAYRFDAAVICAADAPGKLPWLKIAFAGSFDRTWKFTVGNSEEFLAQMSYCVKEPPRLILCDPFSQLRVSSTSRLFALRDCGAALALGLVRVAPTDGKFSWKPC